MHLFVIARPLQLLPSLSRIYFLVLPPVLYTNYLPILFSIKKHKTIEITLTDLLLPLSQVPFSLLNICPIAQNFVVYCIQSMMYLALFVVVIATEVGYLIMVAAFIVLTKDS